MGKNTRDNNLSIVESLNPILFPQDAKPVKIHLEGFSMTELVDLTKRVKDYGGEISCHVENGAMILSYVESSLKTGFPEFIIKWLHACIEYNKLLSPLEYICQIPSTNIEHQVEEEELDPSIEPMNKRSKQKNDAVDCSSIKGGKREISEVSSSRLQVPTNTSKNNVTKSANCKKRRNESSKSTSFRYTKEEDQLMIDYLIKNDAIEIGGGQKIWEQMHKEGMLQNRSTVGLAIHFSSTLNRKAQKFTSDKEALRRFRLRNNRREFERRARRKSSSE